MHGRHGASGEAGEPAAEEGGPGFLTVLFLLLVQISPSFCCSCVATCRPHHWFRLCVSTDSELCVRSLFRASA